MYIYVYVSFAYPDQPGHARPAVGAISTRRAGLDAGKGSGRCCQGLGGLGSWSLGIRGFGVWDLEFRVWGLGFLGFRVLGFRA